MYDVQDVECLGKVCLRCWMFDMKDVKNVKCLGSGMFGMQNVWGV